MLTGVSPDGQGEPSSRLENSLHLVDAGQRIREELEAMLADNGVERVIRERNFRGIRFHPLNRRTGDAFGAGDSKHGRAEIQANNASTRAHDASDYFRDNSRTARKVKNLLPR